MDWLKKHWKLIAAFAVGVPVVYWLYQTYQANSSGASADLQNQTAADTAQYAQQIALGNINQGIGGGSGGGFSSQSGAAVSSPTDSASVTSTTPKSPFGTVSNTDPNFDGTPYGLVRAPNGVWVEPGALAPLTPSGGGVAASPVPAQTYGGGEGANATQPARGFTSTLFGARAPIGTGGGSPGRVAQASPADTVSGSDLQAILSPHIGSGIISDHQSTLPTPTTLELASLGSRR